MFRTYRELGYVGGIGHRQDKAPVHLTDHISSLGRYGRDSIIEIFQPQKKRDAIIFWFLSHWLKRLRSHSDVSRDHY